jgi:hypothetical protein
MLDTSTLKNVTVRTAIEALQSGDVHAWSSLFEAHAELFDDGKARSLAAFTRDALGHERFKRIDQIAPDGLSLEGEFHSDQWGEFRTYFRFKLSAAGKIVRLDIGEA